MNAYRPLFKRCRVPSLIIVGLAVVWLPRAFQGAPSAAEIPLKVHIALGIHVNLYHSFREDTNDENSIGQDIRGIRRTGSMALPYRDGMLFHWERINAQGVRYRIYCRGMFDSEEMTFTTAGRSLFVRQSDLPQQSGVYTASTEADHSGSDQPVRSADIRFRLDRESDTALAIPMDFKAKVLWANLSAWIQRNLL